MTEKSGGDSFAWAVSVLLALPLAMLYALYAGWAVSVLWGWFVVPLGPPAIGVMHAAGLLFTAGAARSSKAWIRDEYRPTGRETVMFVIGPAVAVLLGGFIKALM